MTYVMEKALVDHVNAQRKEAEEFSKQPGCWMGKFPCPTDIEYWSERVPSGTLREFQRTELVEDAYYITADRTSKSYARSFDFASMTDAEIRKSLMMLVQKWNVNASGQKNRNYRNARKRKNLRSLWVLTYPHCNDG